jgi:hypothetical protein
MGFETFKRQRAAPATEPTLTIQKRGALSLNTPAFEAMGKPEEIELLYDRDENIIGMRKAAPGTPHAYPVRAVGKTGATHVISGKGFLKYYGIERGIARRWPAEMRNGILAVDLKQTPTEFPPASSKASEG